MSWENKSWFDWVVLFLIAGAIALSIVGIALKTEEPKTETFSDFNLQKFSVAGGGEQFVLEWESEGTHYEIMIKKEKENEQVDRD